ncbi:MAG: hypothetical protein OHK0022_51910 [Roseiflexaceae bacterium]
MSRNQLLAIIGVLLVLGVALQRSPVVQPSQSVSCLICPGPLVQIGLRVWGVLGVGITRDVDPVLPSNRSDFRAMGRAGWFATPEPLLKFVPAATPQHTPQPWHSECLNC